MPFIHDGGSIVIYRYLGLHPEHEKKLINKDIFKKIWNHRQELLFDFQKSAKVQEFQVEKIENIIDSGNILLKKLAIAQTTD